MTFCFKKQSYKDDLVRKSYLPGYSLKTIQREKTKKQKTDRKDLGAVYKRKIKEIKLTGWYLKITKESKLNRS